MGMTGAVTKGFECARRSNHHCGWWLKRCTHRGLLNDTAYWRLPLQLRIYKQTAIRETKYVFTIVICSWKYIWHKKCTYRTDPVHWIRVFHPSFCCTLFTKGPICHQRGDFENIETCGWVISGKMCLDGPHLKHKVCSAASFVSSGDLKRKDCFLGDRKNGTESVGWLPVK